MAGLVPFAKHMLAGTTPVRPIDVFTVASMATTAGAKVSWHGTIRAIQPRAWS